MGDEFLFALAFLADFKGNVRDTNLELRGENKCIAEKPSTVSSCKSKLKLMITDLTSNTSDHFPNMQDHLEKCLNFIFQAEKYFTEICSVVQDLRNRFCDLQEIRRVVQGGPDSIRQFLIINNQSIQQHTGKWESTFCCR
jgi:hypothetical protein